MTAHTTRSKDNRTNAAYMQRLIDFIRWHECCTGQTWPGRGRYGQPAHTRYPNLCAEIAAHQYFLWCPASHAEITTELLADVIEAGEKLEWPEIAWLSRLFECPTGYLVSPSLSLVVPSCNKGKLRRQELHCALELLRKNGGPEKWDIGVQWDVKRAEQTLDQLLRNELVTYAAWRTAMEDLRFDRSLLALKARGRK